MNYFFLITIIVFQSGACGTIPSQKEADKFSNENNVRVNKVKKVSPAKTKELIDTYCLADNYPKERSLINIDKKRWQEQDPTVIIPFALLGKKNIHPMSYDLLPGSDPCDRDESEICKKAYFIANDIPILRSVTSDFYLDEELDSFFIAHYFANKEGWGRGLKDYPGRKGIVAINGQYKGTTPVGVWRLWRMDGVLYGITDFSVSNKFVECPVEL